MSIATTAPPKVTTVLPPTKSVYYPETDGKPMAETDTHAALLIYLRTALEDHFRNTPNVYVSGNLLLYYEEGNPSASVAPDVFVVKGVPKGDRRTYKLWEEGKAPNVVIEITSRSTRLEDLGTKRALYAEIGVEEYFIYDPLNEYLRPPLQGYRRDNGDYEPLPTDAAGKLHSVVLDLDLQIVNGELRLLDPHTGKFLLTPLEAQEAARQAQAELERLRAELDKVKSQK